MPHRVRAAALCALLFVLSAYTLVSIPVVRADFGGGTEKIYGCKILSSLLLRIVSSPNDCNALLESPLEWRVSPEDGTEFPYICASCYLSEVDRFAGRNMTNAWFKGSDLTYVAFDGTDLTNANMDGVNASGASFDGANLTNVDFTAANLSGATGMASTTRSGITWNSTTCPDSTNSDSNGGTCEGHF